MARRSPLIPRLIKAAGGSLTKSGVGTLTLNAVSTFNGLTTVTGGVLRIGIDSALSSGIAVTGSGTVLDLNGHALSVGNVSLGIGTSIASGTLTTNGVVSLGMFSVINTLFAGSGSLAISGGVTLTANNTYTGGTSFSGGVAFLNNPGALGSIGVITSPNLQFSPVNTTDYSSRFSTSPTQTMEFDTNGQAITFASPLVATMLQVLGGGTLTLLGNNSISSATNIFSTLLRVGNGTAASLGTGAISNAGTLTVNATNVITIPGVISGAGGLIQAGTGTTTLTGLNNYGATTISAGVLQVGDGGSVGTLGFAGVTDNAALVVNRNNLFTISNKISGSGDLWQSGAGTTVLAGANNYSGSTFITNGVLQVGNGVAGNMGSGPIVNNGTLVFNSPAISLNSPMTGNGAVEIHSGTLLLNNASALNSTSTITFTGGVLQFSSNTNDISANLSSSPGQQFKFDTNSQVVTFGSPLNSVGGSLSVVGNGAGTLILNAANTFDGTTTLSSGTLRYGVDNALGPGRLIISGFSTVFDLNGHTDTVGRGELLARAARI